MALGRKGRNVDNTTHEIDPNSITKEGGQYYDAESHEEKGGRKMSRVAGVMGGESDQDSQLGVGKQLELEATNSIKYRTCSWQKVIWYFSITLFSSRDEERLRRAAAKTSEQRRDFLICALCLESLSGLYPNKWWQTAALLFSEYICLAIMSFPYSYSVLGLVPGLIVTVVIAMSVLYTSLIVWYVSFLPNSLA